MQEFARILIQIGVLVFAVIIHEVAHGYVAYKLGDPTAKNAGRLTFNPIPHIDPFMSILLPGLLIASGAGFVVGGAKPVPINPSYFKNFKRDNVLVSLAGPGSNILMAAVGLLLIWLANFVPFLQNAGYMMVMIQLVMINGVLAIFNLIPIPPLDGSHVVASLLPYELAVKYEELGRFGIFIIIGLMAIGGLSLIMGPFLTGLMLLIRLVMPGGY